MSDLKVGGEVDSYCTKCKMVLAHVVLAIWAGQIKRVRCNTCMGEHAFHRAQPGASSAGSSASPRPVRAKSPAADKPKAAATGAISTSTYDELIADKDRSSARPFNLKLKFAVGDLVQHPTFGLGVVAAARGPDKIDVAFPGSIKTLQHNKSAAPTALAKPPPAKQPDVALPEEDAKQDPAAETSDEG